MAKGESEKQTRKKRINAKLQALGWAFAPDDEPAPKGPYWRDEIATENGPADYGLFVADQLIGIIEAKKLGLGPQNVLSQTERYAEGVKGPYAADGFGVPFIYASNGEVIWFRDTRDDLNRSRKIVAFHAPAGLSELVEHDLDATTSWFEKNPSDNPRLRYYQHDACAAIEKAIADRKRQMLVAMATGTGKTFTDWSTRSTGCMKSGVASACSSWWTAARSRPRRCGPSCVRAGARAEVRQDLRGLQPALPDGGLRRGREASTRTCCRQLPDRSRSQARRSSMSRTIQRMAINLSGEQAVVRRRR